MDTDKNLWHLLDPNFDKIAELPSAASHFKFILNEPGSGSLNIPMTSNAASLVSSGMFARSSYRGAVRGGFSIDNIKKDFAIEGNADGGLWMNLSGSGELILLEDGIVNGDGTTSTRVFTGTKAAAFITLINEAKARTGCLTDVTYDFTASVDSDGVAWTDTESFTVTVGVTLLEVLRQIVKFGIDFRMSLVGGGFVLSAYKNGIGEDVSSTIFFRIGHNCTMVSSDERGGGLKNALTLAFKSGSVSLKDDASIAAYRRREKFVDAENAQDTAAVTTYGAALLDGLKAPKRAIAVKVYDGVAPNLFLDYGMGDTVSLDIEGAIETHRVLGIQCDWDGVNYSNVTLELNALLYENELKMAQDIDWLLSQWNTARDSNLLAVSYWAAIGGSDNPATSVKCSVQIGTNLYFGGTFDGLGGTASANIIGYSLMTGQWFSLGAGLPTNTSINTICEHDGAIVAAGLGLNIWSWDGTEWTSVGTMSGFDSFIPAESTPFARMLVSFDGDLYLGGSNINSVDEATGDPGDPNHGNLAKMVAGVWEWVGTGSMFTWYNCGLVWNGKIFLGGGTQEDEFTFAFIVSYVGSGSSFTSWFSSSSFEIFALHVANDVLYAGGSLASTGLLVSDGTAGNSHWTLLSEVNGTIYGISSFLTDIYLVGNFTAPGSRVVKYSGGAFQQLTTGLDGTGYTITLVNDDVYVGGVFANAGDKLADMVAAYFSNFQSLVDYLENSSSNFDMGGAIHAATAAALTDASEIPFWDAVTNSLRKITWLNIKATLKTYFDTLYVALTGNQTIAGVKTFSSFPVTPSSAPSVDYEVANKKYVDDTAGGGGGTWGSITGTLSAQTDLQSALDGKQSIDADLTAIAGLVPADDDLIQRKAGAWINRTIAQLATDLAAIFDLVYAEVGTEFTDEKAQDAVGTILGDTATIDLTYDDVTPAITGSVKVDSINETHIDWGTLANQVSMDDVPVGATYSKLTVTQVTDLTDAGDSALHFHSTDRARANHTGTQAAATISDFAATVRATVLTGLSLATNAVIAATDTVLVALGKLQAQITAHDHLGGDGGTIAHTSLSAIGTNTHAQIDTHIAATNPHTGSTTKVNPSVTGNLVSFSDNTGGQANSGIIAADVLTGTGWPFTFYRLLYTDAAGNVAVTDRVIFDPTSDQFVFGGQSISNNANIRFGGNTGNASAPNSTNSFFRLIEYGVPGSSTNLFRGTGVRGTKASPTASLINDVFVRLNGGGYPGTGNVEDVSSTGGVEIVADENQSATTRGTRIDFYTTPNTTATKTLAASVKSAGGLNIPATKTYDVGGVPHVHDYVPEGDWVEVADTWTYLTPYSFTVPAGATAIYSPGTKVRWIHTGAYLYGVINTVTSTVLTLIPSRSDAVLNSSIGDVAYSNGEAPYNWPQEFRREALGAARTYYVRTTPTTFTVTIASPAVFTKASHGLSINDPLVFTTTGALPTGLVAGTVYYIISAGFTTGAFRVSASVGGAAVNTSGTQSGTHSYTTGNDSNNGRANSRTGALLTIQKALDLAAALDFATYAVTIQIQDSLYTAQNTIKPWVGSGTLTIQGNAATPANVLVSVTSAQGFYVSSALPDQVYIKDMKIQTTTAGNCVLNAGTGTVNVANINFGATAEFHLSVYGAGAVIVANGNYTISGGGVCHWVANAGGRLVCSSKTLTFSGTPAFSFYFAYSSRVSILEIPSITWSGSFTGNEYYVDGNAVIFFYPSATTYLPGTGTSGTGTGGQAI